MIVNAGTTYIAQRKPSTFTVTCSDPQTTMEHAIKISAVCTPVPEIVRTIKKEEIINNGGHSGTRIHSDLPGFGLPQDAAVFDQSKEVTPEMLLQKYPLIGQMIEQTGAPNLTVINLIAKDHWQLWRSHPCACQQFKKDTAAWG